MSREYKDISGNKINMITVLYRLPDKIAPSGQHIQMWRCKCDCGKEISISRSHLNKPNLYSCGCETLTDLKDEIIDKITVISKIDGGTSRDDTKWHCKCACGNELDIQHKRLMTVRKAILNGKAYHNHIDCGCGKYISCYDQEGKKVKTYHSIAEATQDLSVTKQCISEALRGVVKTACGYVWKHGVAEELSKDEMPEKAGKSVVLYDNEGNFIKEYPTVMQASIEMGINIHQIYNSIYHHDIKQIKQKEDKNKPNYIWKYKEG